MTDFAFDRGAADEQRVTKGEPRKAKAPRLDVTFREPRSGDGAALFDIVREGGVLDENSSYAYVMFAERFADTCVVGVHEGEVVGFVTAFRPPRDPDVIFVWQIGVHSRMRGQGLARRILQYLVERDACVGVRYMETNITPSNVASQHLFRAFAREVGHARVEVRPGYDEAVFPDAHESEDLYRIGPFAQWGAHA